jgi:hypothetical protein
MQNMLFNIIQRKRFKFNNPNYVVKTK